MNTTLKGFLGGCPEGLERGSKFWKNLEKLCFIGEDARWRVSCTKWKVFRAPISCERTSIELPPPPSHLFRENKQFFRTKKGSWVWGSARKNWYTLKKYIQYDTQPWYYYNLSPLHLSKGVTFFLIFLTVFAVSNLHLKYYVLDPPPMNWGGKSSLLMMTRVRYANFYFKHV